MGRATLSRLRSLPSWATSVPARHVCPFVHADNERRAVRHVLYADRVHVPYLVACRHVLLGTDGLAAEVALCLEQLRVDRCHRARLVRITEAIEWARKQGVRVEDLPVCRMIASLSAREWIHSRSACALFCAVLCCDAEKDTDATDDG